MGRLIVYILLALPLLAKAETQIVLGAVTYHILGTNKGDAKNFRNKWSDDGRLIGTPLVAAERYRLDAEGYTSRKYFAGENSVGGPMAGFAYSSGIMSGHWRLGGLLGLYAQDASKFYDKGMATFGLPIGSQLHIAPLAGGEIVYGVAVKWHLVITPLLALSYLSFSF